MTVFKRKFELSEKKRALLKTRLRAEGLSADSTPPITPRQGTGPAPLSCAQQRLWIINQLEPESPAYNFPAGVRFRGKLNIEALEKSLQEIIQRHAMLRTTFQVVDGKPAQVVAPAMAMPLPLIDLRSLAPQDQPAAIQRMIVADVLRPFDLKQDALIRLKLVCLNNEEHLLSITFHHIISDGWAFALFLRELTAIYSAFIEGKPSPLPPLSVQYVDFACWQRDWLNGEMLQSQLEYWKKQLAGAPALVELPLDRPRPPQPNYRGARHFLKLPARLIEDLRALSNQEGSTLFMTLLAAFNVLLHRYTRRTDMIVGSPVALRNRSEIEGLIGFFLNMLVLRTDLAGNPSFKELLGRVRTTALEAYRHQDVPFETLVEELKPRRELSSTPLFQIMFVFQSLSPALPSPQGLTIEREELDRRASICDLTLQLAETQSDMQGFIEYSTDLFDASTIARMEGHFRTLLEAIASGSEQPIGSLPILPPAERELLLVGWNDTGKPAQSSQCIADLFESQVERTPNAVALAQGAQSLTYRELNNRANQFAHYLQRMGVGPEVLIGICQVRSIDLVISMLAVIKAGGAYVPLDPAYPKERLAFILDDARARILLTQQSLQADLPESGSLTVCIESIAAVLALESAKNPSRNTAPQNLAYVIYTSGSTGRPKGVAVEQRNTVAFIEWAVKTFSPQELKGVLFSTSICFDLSIFELFVPLSCGGKVIVAANALELKAVAARNPVTLINTVPSAMRELVNEALPNGLETVNLAGEALPRNLVDSIYKQPNVKRVYNLYGPSEDTTYSSGALIARDELRAPPIGQPLSEKSIYILDVNLEPVPIGVVGEVFISGTGLARGYMYRPELTASRFVPDPFSPQPAARMYRTGDLARFLPDKNIDYVGRADHQVKIRGYRVEPGEVEAVVNRHPAVSASVVVVVKDERGNNDLVLYVATQDKVSCNEGELRKILAGQMPRYMLPTTIIVMESFPLTPNGKLDRKALPSPSAYASMSEHQYVAPQNALETELVSIWKDVLGKKQIGINDNFFELGGHSLLATQVVARIRKVSAIELPMRVIFQAPTVAQLAISIAESQAQQVSELQMAELLAELESMSETEVSDIMRESKVAPDGH